MVLLENKGKKLMVDIDELAPTSQCGLWEWATFIEAFKFPVLDYDEIINNIYKCEAQRILEDIKDKKGNLKIEKCQSFTSFDDFMKSFDFDRKEIANERAREIQADNKKYTNEFVGKSLDDILARVIKELEGARDDLKGYYENDEEI